MSRPDVPREWIDRIGAILSGFPDCVEEPGWTGVQWRVGRDGVAHVFGGEDQLFRIVFRAEPDEVMAFTHLGDPYFKGSWGTNVVGMLLDENTDWQELAELLTDSYCIQAPQHLAEQVLRPARDAAQPDRR